MRELITLIAVFAFSGFSQETPTAIATKAPQLYLHFLTPGVGVQPRDGQEPQHLKTLTAKITLGVNFDVRIDEDTEYISGLIETQNGKIHIRMESHFANDTYSDDEFVELEKKYYAGHDGIAMSGIIFISSFVLSTNADCKPFLLAKTEPSDNVWKTNTVSKWVMSC
jgi:hypothetical protein